MSLEQYHLGQRAVSAKLAEDARAIFGQIESPVPEKEITRATWA